MTVADSSETHDGSSASVPSSAADAGPNRSGVYARWQTRPLPPRPPFWPPKPWVPFPSFFEELRVDVDGLYPTMTVSGTISRLIGGSLTWLARVSWDVNRAGYAGSITYRDGTVGLEPHSDVLVQLAEGGMRTATVTFTGSGLPDSTHTFAFRQAEFRNVGVEYDWASDATAVTQYDLGSHPNRPADLPNTTLSIEGAFSRFGIAMTQTTGGNAIPIDKAGSDALWSDIEMHDAMQAHWSKWADQAQWQIWVLFAARHESGRSLGGIMFDDIGTAQRQGCAIFSDSFISDPPPSGDPAPDAAVQRMRFWTAVHETGHALNLAHSWQKSLGTAWLPLADEPEARSFMNYPYFVGGGPAAFFADFQYRFSDDELLFMRHAPERFVEPGNAPWFDHHAFQQVRKASASTLELTLRVHREVPRFEALEPVAAELKLKNASSIPTVVDRNILRSDGLTVVIARDRHEPRQWLPYIRYCALAEPHVLQPGESLYAPLFLSAGRGGFELCEPGRYRVYAALRTPSGDVLSAPMPIEVRPPVSREAELMAPDVYTEEVGRVLALGGSRGGAPSMDHANDVLHEVVERLPDSALAIHAAASLGQMATLPGRVLTENAHGERSFHLTDSRPDAAVPLLGKAYADPRRAAVTLGHIGVTRNVEQVAPVLGRLGERTMAADLASNLADTLRERGVLPSVVAAVDATAVELGAEAAPGTGDRPTSLP
ncbi:hypothetical protein [Streptomyces sp. NPDC046939]|uniref:hypothetical protein n=1 Tax=Streptomyces sp. NPDC046939 TaxID=3155376 RepID=UPI0033DC49E1